MPRRAVKFASVLQMPAQATNTGRHQPPAGPVPRLRGSAVSSVRGYFRNRSDLPPTATVPWRLFLPPGVRRITSRRAAPRLPEETPGASPRAASWTWCRATSRIVTAKHGWLKGGHSQPGDQQLAWRRGPGTRHHGVDSEELGCAMRRQQLSSDLGIGRIVAPAGAAAPAPHDVPTADLAIGTPTSAVSERSPAARRLPAPRCPPSRNHAILADQLLLWPVPGPRTPAKEPQARPASQTRRNRKSRKALARVAALGGSGRGRLRCWRSCGPRRHRRTNVARPPTPSARTAARRAVRLGTHQRSAAPWHQPVPWHFSARPTIGEDDGRTLARKQRESRATERRASRRQARRARAELRLALGHAQAAGGGGAGRVLRRGPASRAGRSRCATAAGPGERLRGTFQPALHP